ncbi:MAG TPA: hypothetical protein VJT50_17055, partial [Pyrinomonadaceae bacterium]|nr:hypothetical protein [Pyrinomonadaceae bacterium]
MFGEPDPDEKPVETAEKPKVPATWRQKAGCLVIVLIGLALSGLLGKYINQTLGVIGTIVFMFLLIGW